MTDHNLGTPENKGSICSITNVDGYTLLVFKDGLDYFVDVITPNGEPERASPLGASLLYCEKSFTALRVPRQKATSGSWS